MEGSGILWRLDDHERRISSHEDRIAKAETEQAVLETRQTGYEKDIAAVRKDLADVKRLGMWGIAALFTAAVALMSVAVTIALSVK